MFISIIFSFSVKFEFIQQIYYTTKPLLCQQHKRYFVRGSYSVGTGVLDGP